MRSPAASGWSPNSCASGRWQPPPRNRRRVLRLAAATDVAVRASDSCSAEENSASPRAVLISSRVMETLLASPAPGKRLFQDCPGQGSLAAAVSASPQEVQRKGDADSGDIDRGYARSSR